MDASYYGGLDLGQQADYSAFAVAERTGNNYSIRYLQRWPLKTPYPKIVDDVVALYRRPPLAGSTLCIDATGVGVAIVDLFKQAKPDCRMVPITITSGSKVSFQDGGFHVPKRDLVAVLQVLLGTRRLQIAPALDQTKVLTKELATFKVKVSTGNESFECLVAGTMVETRDGPKPIELVKLDDDVLTRDGYNRVLWAGETKRVMELCRVDFDNGAVLSGTPDHPLWTENRGWVEMQALTCEDLCVQLPQIGESIPTRRLWSSKVSSIESHQALATSFMGNQRTLCTELSGFFTTGRFLQDTIFTMSMRTGRTTTNRISNALRMPSMLPSISSGILQSIGNVLYARNHLFADALVAPAMMILENGFARYLVPMLAASHGVFPAFNAEDYLRQVAMGDMDKLSDFARQCAEKLTDMLIAARLESVQDAARNSQPSIRSRNFVRVSATPSIVRLEKPVSVYDLTIDRCHEFFANGILSRNSWRERDHDDVVLASAVCLWFAERGRGRQSPRLRVFPFGGKRQTETAMRTIVCRPEELASIAGTTERSLLVKVSDPGVDLDLPAHTVDVLDTLVLQFAALELADVAWAWQVPLERYGGLTAEEVIFSRQLGKKFWAFLARHRDPPHEAIIFVDSDAGRAISLALAMMDMVRLPRETLLLASEPSRQFTVKDVPPAQHVYETVKNSRSLVAGEIVVGTMKG